MLQQAVLVITLLGSAAATSSAQCATKEGIVLGFGHDLETHKDRTLAQCCSLWCDLRSGLPN